MPRTAFRFIPSSSVPHDDWYPPPGASADRTLDQSCGSTPWRKVGWYAVPPGGSALVMTGNQHDLPFTNFAWIACTFADGPCWSGNLWYRVMHNNPFNQCFVDDTGCNAL